ncbi:MAG: AMIN domain-containing protein, partial [Candidatus Omnitrophica bacterium]|nr:AMIN domain-containing protein [Candidatus Omnitrophota bacterium]
MRKQTVACVFVGIMIVLGAATTQLFAQSVVLTDTEIKEDNAAVKMLFSTNKSISIECYDLSEPPQIVIDFMGEIYTNRPEVSMVNKGVVKQIRVVRGTKKSTDLDDSFYSVDFIIVDLTEPVRYDFDQGLTNSVLLISRPGKSLEASAEAKEAAPVVQQSPAAPETTAGINPEMKKQESIPLAAAEQEMRQEPEPAVGVSLKAETAEPETVPESAQPKATSANKVSRRTKEVGGGISKGISKFGAGIKNLVTFGKNKKTTPAQASITEKPKVEDSTAVSKKKTRKRVDKSGDKSKKLIAATGKKEVKRRKWKKKTESGSEASDVYVAESGSADTATRLEQARQMLAKCEADLKTAQGEVDSAYAAVENSLENQRTLGMRIALAQEKQKAAEADMNQSVRIIELAKNAANSVWLEYSAAKNELTNLLDQGGENSLVSAAQKKYDSSKAALENALNAVDQAKKDSDAKAAAYETAKKELESLKMSAQDPAKDVTGAQKRYEQNKERLGVMEKKVAQARQEVANAERA